MSTLSNVGLDSARNSTFLMPSGSTIFLIASNTVKPLTLVIGAEQSTKIDALSRPFKLKVRLVFEIECCVVSTMPVSTSSPLISTFAVLPE